jgi:hypothetical protein
VIDLVDFNDTKVALCGVVYLDITTVRNPISNDKFYTKAHYVISVHSWFHHTTIVYY